MTDECTIILASGKAVLAQMDPNVLVSALSAGGFAEVDVKGGKKVWLNPAQVVTVVPGQARREMYTM